MIFIAVWLLTACGPKTTPPELISIDVTNSAIPQALASDDPEFRSLAYGALMATASEEEMAIWWPKFTAESEAYFRQSGIDALIANHRFVERLALFSQKENLMPAERCRILTQLHRIGRDQSSSTVSIDHKSMTDRLNCALARSVIFQDNSELALLMRDATLVTDLPFYWTLQASGLSLDSDLREAYGMAEDSYRMSLLGSWLVLHPSEAMKALEADVGDFEIDDRMELIDFLWRSRTPALVPAIRLLSKYDDRGGLYAKFLLYAMTGVGEKIVKVSLASHRDWEMRALAADSIGIRLASPVVADSDRAPLIDALRDALKESDQRALLLIIRACGKGGVWELASLIAQLSRNGSFSTRLEIEIALRHFVHKRRLLKENSNE